MKIRNYSEEDAVSIRTFVKECKPLGLHTAFTYWILGKYFGDCCVIAEEEEKMIGFCSGIIGTKEPSVFYVWQIGVIPSYRGKGVASELLRRMILIARDKNCNRLEVNIAPRNEASFRTFFRLAKENGSDLQQIGVAEFTDDLTGEREHEYLYQIMLTEKPAT